MKHLILLCYLTVKNLTSWDTRLEVLGWIIDTEALTVTLPPHKREQLCALLAAWPASRASASAKQASKLVFVFHARLVRHPPGVGFRAAHAGFGGDAAHHRRR